MVPMILRSHRSPGGRQLEIGGADEVRCCRVTPT